MSNAHLPVLRGLMSMLGQACGHCLLDPVTGKNKGCILDICEDSAAYDPAAVVRAYEQANAIGAPFPAGKLQRARKAIAEAAARAADVEYFEQAMAQVPPAC